MKLNVLLLALVVVVLTISGLLESAKKNEMKKWQALLTEMAQEVESRELEEQELGQKPSPDKEEPELAPAPIVDPTTAPVNPCDLDPARINCVLDQMSM